MDVCYPGDVHACMSPWQCKDTHMYVMIPNHDNNVKIHIYLYLFTSVIRELYHPV